MPTSSIIVLMENKAICSSTTDISLFDRKAAGRQGCLLDLSRYLDCRGHGRLFLLTERGRWEAREALARGLKGRCDSCDCPNADVSFFERKDAGRQVCLLAGYLTCQDVMIVTDADVSFF